jgi:hypothetical protein
VGPIIAGVVTTLIVAAVIGATKWGREHVARLVRRRNAYQRQPLRLVPQPGTFMWHATQSEDGPAMQVVGHWFATSVSDSAVSVLRAYVRHRGTNHEAILLGIYDHRGVDNRNWPIKRDSTYPSLELEVMCFIAPRPREEGFFRTTVVFVDSFGNHYKQKSEFPKR